MNLNTENENTENKDVVIEQYKQRWEEKRLYDRINWQLPLSTLASSGVIFAIMFGQKLNKGSLRILSLVVMIYALCMIFVFIRHLSCAKVNRDAIDQIQKLYPNLFLNLPASTIPLRKALLKDRKIKKKRSLFFMNKIVPKFRARYFFLVVMIMPIIVSLIVFFRYDIIISPNKLNSKTIKRKDMSRISKLDRMVMVTPYASELNIDDKIVKSSPMTSFLLNENEGHEVSIKRSNSELKFIFFLNQDGTLFIFL